MTRLIPVLFLVSAACSVNREQGVQLGEHDAELAALTELVGAQATTSKSRPFESTP